MDGSTQEEQGGPPDATIAAAAEGSSGLVGLGEGPEDEGELARRAAEDQARLEALGEQDEEEADLDDEVHEEERSNAPSGAFIDTATLGAVHQFLATLSGPEATRAAALRAQLPTVPE